MRNTTAYTQTVGKLNMDDDSDGSDNLQARVKRRINEMQQGRQPKKPRNRLSRSSFPSWGDQNKNNTGKFVKISALDSEMPLKWYDAVLIGQFIENNFPGHTHIQTTSDGNIMLRTRDEMQTRNTRTLRIIPNPKGNIDIKVDEVTSRNQSKGLIYAEELMCTDLTTIVQQCEGIIEIVRLKKRDGDTLKEIPLHLITFNTSELPDTVKIGYMSGYQVRPFFPNPRACRKCHSYSHTINRCQADSFTCKKCGQAMNVETTTKTIVDGKEKIKNIFSPHECNTISCVNCPEDDNQHICDTKQCPAYHIEKAIIEIKTRKNLPYGLARKEFIELNKEASNGESYAEVAFQNTGQKGTVMYELKETEAALDKVRAEKALLYKLKAQLEKELAELDELRTEVAALHQKKKARLEPNKDRNPVNIPSQNEIKKIIEGTPVFIFNMNPSSGDFPILNQKHITAVMKKMDAANRKTLNEALEMDKHADVIMNNGVIQLKRK